MALGKTTQDHDEIQQWAEARGAKPAVVSSTESDNQTGILRLMFPDAPNANDSALEEISWDEWFEKFDASGLEFTYQNETAEGAQSNFNKLTYPEVGSPNAKKLARKSSKSSGSKSSGKKSSGKSAGSKSSANKSAGGSAAKKGSAKSAGKKSSQKTAGKKSSQKSAGKKTAQKGAARKSANKSAGKKGGPASRVVNKLRGNARSAAKKGGTSRGVASKSSSKKSSSKKGAAKKGAVKKGSGGRQRGR